MIKHLKARVIKGYGVASGQNGDKRFPGGTIFMQKEYFRALGLNIDRFFSATLNIDIAPYSFEIINPKYFFKEVNWTEQLSAENFYFFDIKVKFQQSIYTGYIYMPDPETKEEHIQGKTTLELLLPKIENIKYGDEIEIEIPGEQMKIIE